jgi:phenylacetic acid degradation protein
MLDWKTEGTALYQALPAQLHATLREAEPLREIPIGRRERQMSYRTWGETRS